MNFNLTPVAVTIQDKVWYFILQLSDYELLACFTENPVKDKILQKTREKITQKIRVAVGGQLVLASLLVEIELYISATGHLEVNKELALLLKSASPEVLNQYVITL